MAENTKKCFSPFFPD